MKTILQATHVSDAVNSVKDINPNLYFVLVVILAVIFITIYVTIFVVKVNSPGKKIKELPCDKRGDKIEAMGLDIRELLTLARMNPQSDQKPTLKEAVTAQNSPRAITSFGRQVYKDSGSEVFYTTHKELFLQDIERFNPMTKLDVETMSLRVLLSRLSEDIFKPLKDWVYENPYMTTPNNEK